MRRGEFFLITAIGLSVAILGTGCARTRSSSGQWASLSPDQLSRTQHAQWERAVAARDDLFGQLMTRLQVAIEQQGTASAIGVCQEAAPTIARAVGEARNLLIGRTSWKLRNPENLPPSWATALVAARTEVPAALAHPDGRLGVLLPIRLKGQCLACHGAAEAIPAEVRNALQTRYPNDAATGFVEGDLRGWFWVEVPSE